MRGMNILVDCPRSSAGELRFTVLGVPVGVKFWFWLSTLLLCGAQDTASVLIWVAVCLASVLMHELGHVLAFRLFGERADVVLYGWGGLTMPWHSVNGTVPRVVVALAGPAAGFCVVVVVIGIAWMTGFAVQGFPILHIVPPGAAPLARPSYGYVLLSNLLWVNLAWSLINLLPVYPLDGAQAAQAIFERNDPHGGRRKMLIVSTVAGGLMSAFGMMQRNLYLVLAFLVLALSSAQALESAGGGGSQGPHRRWSR
jgi:stage IV sporulation protein FB